MSSVADSAKIPKKHCTIEEKSTFLENIATDIVDFIWPTVNKESFAKVLEDGDADTSDDNICICDGAGNYIRHKITNH
mgnify:CR=1 FL=1